MKFSIKDFFSKFEQICSSLRIRSHLLKISSMENFIFVHYWVWKYPLFVFWYNKGRQILPRFLVEGPRIPDVFSGAKNIPEWNIKALQISLNKMEWILNFEIYYIPVALLFVSWIHLFNQPRYICSCFHGIPCFL